jgi:hypothetical protein
MNWLLHLYPVRWRERYGEEFSAVLARQRATPGLIFDVLGGAIDAHLHPQIPHSTSNPIQGDDAMTLAMLTRCAAGGPKLSPGERRIAFRLSILSALAIAALYLVLTKIYREAPAVQAVYWTSIFFPNFIYQQTIYLKKRLLVTQALVLGAGLSAMYLFMLTVCVVGKRL